MTDWMEHHRLAEAAADQAEAAERAGDVYRARMEFARAAKHEEAAFRSIDLNKKRTLSIIGLSAVSLYDRAAETEEVSRLSHEVLSRPGLQPFARRQIIEILRNLDLVAPTKVEAARRYDKFRGSSANGFFSLLRLVIGQAFRR